MSSVKNTFCHSTRCPGYILLYSLKSFASEPLHLSLVQDDLLRLLGRSNVPAYMAVACILVQEGSDVHIKNKRGHNAVQLCPDEIKTALINFINKSK